MKRVNPRWFYPFAAAFVFTACFHVAAAVDGRIDPAAPAWRHLLFVGINLACVGGLLRRPSYFVPPFAVLLVQQTWSHGGALLGSLAPGERFDWPSLSVVLVMPLAFGLVLVDVLARRRSSSELGRPKE
ncbi:MAG: hypothetical protein U0271_33370 [Polyangiaceae bacterium]